MKKVVVISNKMQYEALLENGYNIGELHVICDNPRMRNFLRNKNIDYYFLEEFLIPEEDRKAINSWGCDTAAKWIGFCRERKFFTELDLASCVFLKFGYLLVQILKNFYYAKHTIDIKKPSSVIVFKFKEETKPKYPAFSGNVFLNNFLEEISIKKGGMKVEYVYTVFKKDKLLRGLLSWKSIFAGWMRNSVRKILNTVYGKIIRPKNDIGILAHGALKHLLPVIGECKRRKEKIVLYDFEFRWKSFKAAFKLCIPYFIADCFPQKQYGNAGDFVKSCEAETSKALNHACIQRIFTFRSYDFSEFIKKNIFSDMQGYYYMLFEWMNHCEKILNYCDVSAFLTDENTTTRNSFMATFFKEKNINVFCISHATLPVNFSVSRENMVYDVATTFVNSEFEKEMYEFRGWDGNNIEVTGIPRYDRLVKMHERQKQYGVRREAIRLLYCGASMKLYWPERGGYLGFQIKSQGDAQRQAIRSIFDSIKGLPIELIAKPHNFEGSAWYRFFEEEKPQNKTSIEKYSADFFKLLNSCDAMILSHWSTALIESAIFQKPTILLDYYNSKDLAPYAEFGYCVVVRNDSELKIAVKRLYRHLLLGEETFKLTDRGQKFESVFGKTDANSRSRIVDYMEKVLNDKKNTP